MDVDCKVLFLKNHTKRTLVRFQFKSKPIIIKIKMRRNKLYFKKKYRFEKKENFFQADKKKRALYKQEIQREQFI